MKKLALVPLFACLVVAVSGTAYDYIHTPYEKLPEHIQKERDNLYNANMDFIRYVWPDYYVTRDARHYTKFACDKYDCKDWGSYIDGKLAAENESGTHNLAILSTKTKPMHIGSELFCSYRTQYNNDTYEYWMLNMHGDHAFYKKEYRNIGYKYCEFIITKSPSIWREREIIHRSDRFFKTFKVDDGFTLVYPDELFQSTFLGHGFAHCPGSPVRPQPQLP